MPQRYRAAMTLELVAEEPRMLPLQHPLHHHDPKQTASPGAAQLLTGFRPCFSAVADLLAPHRSQHQPQLPVANRSGLAGCGVHLVVQGAVLVQLAEEACHRLERPPQLHTGLPPGLAPHLPQPRRYLARSFAVSGQNPSPLMAGHHHRARERLHGQSSQPCENGQGPLGQPQSMIRHRHHAAAPSCPAGVRVLGVQALPSRTQPERHPYQLPVVR